MQMRFRLSSAWGFVLACMAPAAFLGSAQGVEPAKDFLEALREKKYYDVAVDYLDQMAASKLAPVDLKRTLEYERGALLIDLSRTQRDLTAREKTLNKAEESLGNFIKQLPNDPLVASANSSLANLLVERGRMKLEIAKKGGNKELLRGQAKEFFDKAYAAFKKAEDDFKSRLEAPAMKGHIDEKKEPQRHALREQIRKDYLQSQLVSAAVLEEAAEVLDPASKEYKDLCLKAAKEYGEIHDKYRTRLAGLYACMYRGRCLQKAGDHKAALTYLNELVDQPDDPREFRDLKTKALNIALKSWANQKLVDEAVKKAGGWAEKIRPQEERDPDWLEFLMGVAKLYKSAYDAKPTERESKKLLADAKQMARNINRYTTDQQKDLQKEARDFLASLPGGVDTSGAGRKDPKTFAEAKDAGKEAIEAIQTHQLVVTSLPPQILAETDEAAKKEMQARLDDAKKALAESQDDAFFYFRRALGLVNTETSIDDLNVVRYFLCYLNFTKKQYPEAAVLGEFLARRYPDSSGARQSAKIAMASFLKLYADNANADKQWETDRIIRVAQHIAKQWPDQPEAIEALNTLIPFMIKDGHLDKAQDFLTKIPEDSPQRGMAELKTGQAIWGSYLRGADEVRQWKADNSTPPEVNLPKREQELDALKKRAEKVLADGVARMQSGGAIDQTVATAVLSLAQIYVDTEQAEKAVALLENKAIGALTLAKQNHEATSKPGFVAETYKTALRAHIASLATAKSGGEQTIEKAKEAMDGLKKSVGTSEKDQEKLIAIYVSLARDLQKQMNLASSPAAKSAMSKGFETFLQQVGKESNEFNIVYWVAETFAAMAGSFDTDPKTLTAEAKKFYDLSVANYSRILERGKANAGWIKPPAMETQVRMKLAVSRRRLGLYKEAVDELNAILLGNAMLLNVQKEAAMTYQEWAASGGDARLFGNAILGARPDERKDITSADGKTKKPNLNFKKPVIWGWMRLAEMTMKDPKFRSDFYEARYNMARARYEYAKVTAEKDQKQKMLETAYKAILLTYKTFPEMGGDEWQPRFDSLLRSLQKDLGQKPTGLKGLEQPDPAADPKKVANAAS